MSRPITDGELRQAYHHLQAAVEAIKFAEHFAEIDVPVIHVLNEAYWAVDRALVVVRGRRALLPRDPT